MSAKHTATPKPQMLLKWADEPEARPISRADAAKNIWANRKRPIVKVSRKYGETYIVSQLLGVGCCIYRAALSKAEGKQ